MKQLWHAVDFIRQTRRQLRFGELSRSPLRLLRLEVRGEEAECEWIARQPDAWDADLGSHIRNCNGSLQALQDALAMRDLLFSELPGIQTAELRVYREIDGGERELIIVGTVTRADTAPKGIRSVAMQAKLQGLRFWSDDGILGALQQEKQGGSPQREPAFVWTSAAICAERFEIEGGHSWTPTQNAQ